MLAIASLGLLCVPAAAAQERPRATEAVRAGACGQRCRDRRARRDHARRRRDLRLRRGSHQPRAAGHGRARRRAAQATAPDRPRPPGRRAARPHDARLDAGPGDCRADVRDAGDRHPSRHARHDRRPGDPRAASTRGSRERVTRPVTSQRSASTARFDRWLSTSSTPWTSDRCRRSAVLRSAAARRSSACASGGGDPASTPRSSAVEGSSPARRSSSVPLRPRDRALPSCSPR